MINAIDDTKVTINISNTDEAVSEIETQAQVSIVGLNAYPV